MKWRRLLAAGLSGILMAGLCACGERNDTADNLPDVVLKPEDYQVETVEADWREGFLWFFCADQRFFYTAGVQELMDDASREVPLYAFDPETKETEEITLPLGEGWHLYTMTPAPDGGYWMAFTPLTFGGTATDYTPNPCWLVKTDEDFREQVRIDLSAYSQEQVRIINAICPKSSQYARDSEDSLGWVPAEKMEFMKPELICDDQGRVYVAAVNEDLLVFDQDGTLLTELDVFDVAYAQGVCLAKTYDGTVAVGLTGGSDYQVRTVDKDSLTLGDPLERQTEEGTLDRLTPAPSLLPEYDLFGYGYYGLYGVRFGEDGTYSSEPLLYYGTDNDLPQDGNGTLRETTLGRQLAYMHLGELQEDGTKTVYFDILTMK